jgi:hypothetical protein
VILSAALGAAWLRHQQEAIEREALNHVERISILLERELAAQAEVVRALAHSPLLDGALDEAAFAELARRIRGDQPLWATVVLTDPHGNRLVDVPEPVGGVARGRVVDEASHAEAVATRQPVIGRMLRGPRNRPGFAIRVPAVRGDEVRSVVSAVIEPNAASAPATRRWRPSPARRAASTTAPTARARPPSSPTACCRCRAGPCTSPSRASSTWRR